MNFDLCYGLYTWKLFLLNRWVTFVTIGINEDDWVCTDNFLFAVDLNKHRKNIDAYVFGVVDNKKRKVILPGWIYFKDLLSVGREVKTPETTFMTVPVEILNPMEMIKK